MLDFANSTSENSTSASWLKSKLAEVEIGRSRNWPKSNMQCCCVCCVLCWCELDPSQLDPPHLDHPPPDSPPPDRPKFCSFFSLLPPQFAFFFLSLGVLSMNFVGACETPHISRHRRFKHLQNSTKGRQERERRKKIVVGRGKKKREILGPILLGSTLLCSTLLGSTLLGSTLLAPPFWVWASTLRGPTLCRPKIPKIGRSRNWPKSKLAEVEIGQTRKKELAEVVIGRS